MRRIHIYLVLLTLPLLLACTTQSSIDARQDNYDIQRIQDRIHLEMYDAVSMLIEESEVVDEDAKVGRRDRLTEWDRDYGMANTKKAVTVDAYLFSQIGFFNWLGEKLGLGTRKLIKTWDDAQPATKPALE